MKILIVGAGAIGGYYGARLIEGGADVTFMVRPARAARLQQDGLVVRSALGDFRAPVKTVLRDGVAPQYDLVLLSPKTYDLDNVIEEIAGKIGNTARILPFLNGMSCYDRLDQVFGKERVLGGIAYIATMLAETGEIIHFGSADAVIVGARSASAEQVAADFHALISKSQGSRVHAGNASQALWNKWVMLAAGAAMNCLMRGTLADILSTDAGRALLEQAINECSAVAQAQGYGLSGDELAAIRQRLLDPASTWAASMMRDIAQGARKIEAAAIVGDMVTRAGKLGVDASLMRVAYCHLQVYERQCESGSVASSLKH